MLPEGKRRQYPTPPFINQGTIITRHGFPLDVSRKSGLINENTQAGWRMIF